MSRSSYASASAILGKSIPRISLFFLGWFLFLVLAGWIVVTVLGVVGRPPLPRLFGIGAQHASEFTFSANVQKHIQEAQARMDATNHSYNTVRWLADLATWVSFFATAAITLITGGFNLPRPRVQGQDGDAEGRTTSPDPRPMRFYTLGFLAAVASVCTLLGAQLGTKASTTLACAKEIRDRITEVAQAIKDNPQNEVVLLTGLRDATGRSCS
jgi:hypothetical protein